MTLAAAILLAFELRSPDWTVTVDPATLAATARLTAGTEARISAALPTEPVAGLKADSSSATWTRGRVRMQASMKANSFSIRFSANEAGRVTWPSYGPPPSGVSYILPRGEGLLMSPADPIWQGPAWNRELSFLEHFSLPCWGILTAGHTLTYLATNPFDNSFTFQPTPTGLTWRFTHEFKRHWAVKEFGFDVVLGPASPIEPALEYRRRLQVSGQFVSLREKVAKTPAVANLVAAPHAYLWSGGSIARHDVGDWMALVRWLAEGRHPLAARIRAGMEALPAGKPSAYQQRQILKALDDVLRETPATFPQRAAEGAAALPGVSRPPATWGDALSVKMLERLRQKGFERFWLGVPSLHAMRGLPAVAQRARDLGFLMGPYDSYDSIHAPGQTDTWETAQFDAALFERGAIRGPDGRGLPGFQGKGYWLSSIAARPYFERRVARTFASFPFNSFFLDCDGTGMMHDNYAPGLVATQADDLRQRLSRLRHVVEQYGAVTGSEDGIWTAAPALHFSHGMMTPVFGWNDPRFRDKGSPHYLGAYWPPDNPAVFTQRVPLPDDYRDIYYNPRTRIPLYQAALHDSLITTHHWTRPSLKFTNVRGANELLELLYNVPPLYHLNWENLDALAPAMLRHQRFFAPLHRELAFLPMTGFRWLTEDRMVQATVFGAKQWELVANFGRTPFVVADGVTVPPESLAARRTGGATSIYRPELN